MKTEVDDSYKIKIGDISNGTKKPSLTNHWEIKLLQSVTLNYSSKKFLRKKCVKMMFPGG
jgi:hypothetical protein